VPAAHDTGSQSEGTGTWRTWSRGAAGAFIGGSTSGGSALKAWICLNCGFVYDEAKGDPDAGIAPGTAWDDVPDDWVCPDCGAPKSSFEMVEI